MADIGSMVGGAVVSEALRSLIEEVKKFRNFKPLSKELASTMETLLPIVKQIESMQDVRELKDLKETMSRADEVVEKCGSVKKWNKSMVTREIEEINKDMLRFCQIELQLILLRNQGLNAETINNYLQIIINMLARLSVPAPVYTDHCSVPELSFVPVGLEIPLMDLKKKLLDDAVVSLCVSAPPGSGKTTLVTHLCHHPDIERKFEHIFFTVVSRTPNFRGIVQKLRQDNGEAPHTFDNDSEATGALRKLLGKLKEDGPILLVLDDVWHGAELSFLQKFKFDLQGYKILVTSRSGFSTLSSTYRLKPLKDKDAESLLIRWASQPDHTSQDEYKDLLQKILKRCNGFPIVIEVVGVSLKGQPLYVWKGKVESWSEGETILDEDDVLKCLQPSFDALEPHFQECFRDMGSFLEDQKIRASVIIDIWTELYGKGSNSCMKDLNDLASQNLLKLIPLGGNGHEDGFYNEFLITQHDILRELAIRQSKSEEKLKRKRLNLEIIENKFPDWCKQPINARLLSISTYNAFSSKWVEMDCPNVEVLILNISSLDYTLPSFIAKMKKLKVLTITNHGFFPTRLSNFSCLRSLPNLKRIRVEKASITLLDLPQLQLGSLEKLSLVMCSFGEVFYDAMEEIDISEALPNLQEIDIDYCYDLDELPYWITEEAVSLKTVSITNCNKLTTLPEAIGNLSELQVLRLSSCISLSELPETTERLSNLWFLDISDCFELRKLPLEIGNLQKLKKISMSKCWRCELPDSVKNLENLEVRCDEETEFVLWEKLKRKMKFLSVHVEVTEHSLKKMRQM